jgi:hypothetical protein
MKFISIIVSVFIFIGLCVVSEYGAGLLIANKKVRYYQPLEVIQQHADVEDWRLTLSLADTDFEFDPVLFWKKKLNALPFNTVDSATSSCTMLVYGDSNVQGSVTSWPREMQKIFLEEHVPIQVFNFGVMGYSSYQGVHRYINEASLYPNAIVLLSFGWNDAAPSVQIPDKQFGTYVSSFARTSTLLYTSNLFRIIKYYSDALFQQFQSSQTSYVPRVSLDEYKENLETFIHVAKKNNHTIVFVTRPYVTSQVMSLIDSTPDLWRMQVPEYTAQLLHVAEQYGVPVIDLQTLYEQQFNYQHFVDDNHFTETGNAYAAQIIVRELKIKNVQCPPL